MTAKVLVLARQNQIHEIITPGKYNGQISYRMSSITGVPKRGKYHIIVTTDPKGSWHVCSYGESLTHIPRVRPVDALQGHRAFLACWLPGNFRGRNIDIQFKRYQSRKSR
jgi:hypothetical protein